MNSTNEENKIVWTMLKLERICTNKNLNFNMSVEWAKRKSEELNKPFSEMLKDACVFLEADQLLPL